MLQQVHATRAAHLVCREDGILEIAMLAHADVEVEDIEEISALARTVCANRTTPILVDIRQLRSASREAREAASSNTVDDTTVALAIVIDSPLSTMLGNLYIGMHKPPFPARLFTSTTDAVTWLGQFADSTQECIINDQ